MLLCDRTCFCYSAQLQHEQRLTLHGCSDNCLICKYTPNFQVGLIFNLSVTGLQGHPEFTDEYMDYDLKDRIESGDLPKEVGEAAIRDLHENPVSQEHWEDMQKLLKTFLKVDHPSANVYI